MQRYKAQNGDSPTNIARKFGVSRDALLAANPHKPQTTVMRQRTWQSLHRGETVHVPFGGVGALGMLGAIAPSSASAPHGQIQKGSKNADVALWQTIIGVTADGDFGAKTDAATRAWQSSRGLSADGIVGTKTWAVALGNMAPAASVPVPAAAAIANASSLALSAGAALIALNADRSYCSSVTKVGTAVNTAVHNFKAAWNGANPSNPVPIGTGKYEPSVASALSAALGGVPVPPGCGATASTPVSTPVMTPVAIPMPAPMPVPVSIPVSVPVVSPAPAASANFPAPPAGMAVPAAVQALSSIDPCDPANAGYICQAQAALGNTHPDGKYGTDTAAAARRVWPSAPAACSPRPSWWAPTGSSSCPGAAPPPAPAPMPSSSSPVTSSSPAPSGPSPLPVLAPEKKGISTGAIVAGAIGATALVGLIAAAAMSKKPAHAARHSSAHKSAHKPAHKATKHKKAKRSKK